MAHIFVHLSPVLQPAARDSKIVYILLPCIKYWKEARPAEALHARHMPRKPDDPDVLDAGIDRPVETLPLHSLPLRSTLFESSFHNTYWENLRQQIHVGRSHRFNVGEADEMWRD